MLRSVSSPAAVLPFAGRAYQFRCARPNPKVPARQQQRLNAPLHGELIRRAAANDRVAQRAIYDRYADAVYGVCRRLARTPEEASDFAQDAWLRAFARLGDYRGEGSFEGWLRHLAANTAISTLRRRGLTVVELPEVLPQGAQVGASALDQLSADEILAEIARLPEGYRLVFTLVAVEGFSHAEAAAALGISESSSRSQLTRARAALQRRLSQINFVCL